MKFAFASLFVFAFLALTVSSQYVELTKTQISRNSQFLEDIRKFGIGYVVQKGVYERADYPLPGENYNLTAVEKIERRSTSTAAYYRFTVLLTEQEEQATARAIFTIRYDHRNGACVVTSYKYTILEISENDVAKGSRAYIVIDVRPFNDGIIDELAAFKARIKEIVADAIKKAVLPKSAYKLGFVYSGLMATWTERKIFYVKVVNTKGVFFRIEFDYYSPPATDNGDYYRVQKNVTWRK